jgi:hypothetical protein
MYQHWKEMRMRHVALALLAVVAITLPNAGPVKLTKDQMRTITAGANPNIAPNGTNVNSNGASGAPGGSFGAPGQTNNPNPGK